MLIIGIAEDNPVEMEGLKEHVNWKGKQSSRIIY
jgi:hypothetical protein